MRVREINFVDFEFYAAPGELPIPLCMVALEKYSKRWLRCARGEFPSKPPYSIDKDSIFVCFAADAELLCHRALGWAFPENVIDLHVEYLNCSNALERSGHQQDSLLAVLAEFGIDHISSLEKEQSREIAIKSGGSLTSEQMAALLKYNESDVLPLVQLYDKLIGAGNIAQAIERGRYMKAVTLMEASGVPIDIELLTEFRAKWNTLKFNLVDEVNRDFNVYEGVKFSHDKFKDYIRRRNISWPSTPNGLLKTNKETFKEKIPLYPELAPLHELKSTLDLMRRESITVGSDGRNRTALHAFRAKTSRNLPGSSAFIFGAPSWMRSFVKPQPGRALCYIDFEQQEFCIAAVLSRDKAMQEAYRSGDPYLSFARMARAVPANATKNSHPQVRELYKTCALGIQYSMQAIGLAHRLGKSEAEAQVLLNHHQEQFPDFWRWVERVVTHMEFKRYLCTKSGWRVVRRDKQFPARWRRSAQNWLIQSTGADVLRLCCCLITEAGISLCCPVHDAILIEDSADRIEQTVKKTRQLMAEASRTLLDGFEIKTEAVIFRNRFVDKRGVAMWNKITRLMASCDGEPQGSLLDFPGVRGPIGEVSGVRKSVAISLI